MAFLAIGAIDYTFTQTLLATHPSLNDAAMNVLSRPYAGSDRLRRGLPLLRAGSSAKIFNATGVPLYRRDDSSGRDPDRRAR